jgi:VCBS repeat protein
MPAAATIIYSIRRIDKRWDARFQYINHQKSVSYMKSKNSTGFPQTLIRIGIVIVTIGATLGLYPAPEPVRGDEASNISAPGPKISVRVTETAAASVRLRQSAASLSAASGPGESGQALASADFDEDGVPDLVTGYAAPRGGRLSVQRGNVDAIYPNSAEAQARRARGEFTAAAFHPARQSIALPEAADFVGTGDFDADGHWDIVAARKGGTRLYWLRGDGRGNFGPPQIIEVAGAITALATGEINRVDGLTDIAVGIVAADGARVLIFEAAEGALRRAPESIPLSAAATAFAFGQLDDHAAADLAIASGNEVIVVHGRDRKLSLDAEQQAQVRAAELSRIPFEAEVVSIAVGDFARDLKQELAVLTADGSVRVLNAQTNQESMKMRADARGSSPPRRLLAAKVSALPKDDLLVFGGGNTVQLLTTRGADTRDASGKVTQAGNEQISVAASMEGAGEVAAMLPMRLNGDALKDLVVLPREGAPTIIETVSSVFVVNTTARTLDANPGDGVCADGEGKCSFVAAIMECNAKPGPHTINFNIPGGGVPTVATVVPGAVFNQVNEAVTIDGTTQPGGRVEVNSDGFTPLIFYGGNSVLRGVAIYGGSASLNLASDGNIVEGNYIGFRPDGSKPSFGVGGITFRGGINGSRPGNNNLVGGTTAQARNVISNCNVGLNFSDNTGNVVKGNYVGTTIDGTAALPNARNLLAGDSDVVVGGTTAGAGNLFSGANGTGTFSTGLALGRTALIQGNRFGTTADGMQPIANGGYAIEILTNELVTIGGTTPAARNLISGSLYGIQVSHDQGEATLIQGNYIGTNVAGTGALPNLGDGIRLTGVRAVTVGGASSGAGNLISGNGENGINLAGGINGTPCRGAIIQGNLIGTNATGVVAIPNQKNGIEMPYGFGVLIGGRTAEARNVISGNVGDGVQIQGGDLANPNRIEGNFIGTNIFGTGALGNRKHGIYFFLNVQGHNIGGPVPEAGNRIAFNLSSGIASERPNLGAAILSNSIFANGALGIDQADNGVTPSACGLSAAPVINSVETSGSQTTIRGSLCTLTVDGGKAPYTIQFFSNGSPDPSGYGEGQTLIGQTTVEAGAQVAAPFSVTITPAIPPGRYLSAVAVGPVDARIPNDLSSSEFSFNARVAGVATPENTPLRLNVITPMTGGDSGSITVTIIGEGISQGATVVLRRAGQADIVGQYVGVSEDGSSANVRFNLKGQALGGWDVVVTNPNGTSTTLAGAYTIENGQALPTRTAFLGHSAIRKGKASRYTLLVQNPQNNDLYGVPVFVTGIPANAKVKLNFELTPVPRTPELPSDFDPNSIPPVIQTDSGQMIALVIPVLPAKTNLALGVELTFPEEGSRALRVFSTPPLLRVASGSAARSALGGGNFPDAPGDGGMQLELSDDAVNCLHSIFQNAFGCLTSFTPVKAGQDCAKAVLSGLGLVNNLASIVVSTPSSGGGKVMSFTQLTGAAISTALDAGKCFGDTFPPAKILDVISCGLSLVNIVNDCAPDISDLIINIFTPRDPNDKVGATGAGAEHFITGALPLPYMILFENKPEATASAQDVVITDQLDIAKLDLDTFQLGTISFGNNTVVTPPAGLSAWTTDIDLRPANKLVVRMIAALDKTTGLVTWRFFSLDPATLQPTEEPLAGFLPPNKTAPEGDGAVTFTINAKPNQASGTQIRNQARIIFDTNAPIDTPTWLNTIDNSPPVSQVLPLAANQTSTRFQVTWNGSDTGAGISAYTIFVSENGGAYTVWLGNTTSTSAFFDGNPNSSYSFYSVAKDGAGNSEAAPASPDATVAALPAGQLLNISTRMRVLTGDNVLIGGLIITGTDPKKVLIRGIGPSLANFGVTNALGDTTLELYQGNTLLASNDNWKISSDGSSQQAEIQATTIPPTNDLESAIVRTLAPGNYTAVLRGKNNLTGIGVVEAYDLDQAANSKFANIATRGFVDTDDNVMIGGTIVGGHNNSGARVLVRAIGPSLTAFGVPGALLDPILELRNANGLLLSGNDDWKESQQAEIAATTLAPTNDLESAVVTTLPAGNYTAIVRGRDNTTGVALVEVYNVK